MPTIKLNGRTVSGLTCPPGKTEVTYWSDDLPGFGLRCRRQGGVRALADQRVVRTWWVKYRTKAGAPGNHALGSPDTKPPVPFARAEKKAGELLAEVKLGGDPAGDASKAKRAIKHATKLSDLIVEYLAHQEPRLKPRSYTELKRHLEAHARPLHGRRARELTQTDIVELLEGIGKAAPVTANRVRASLSAMFAWGMKAGRVQANPVTSTFKPSDEKPRARVLRDAELVLIWRATDGGADHDRNVRLLMLTGARREETAGMARPEITVHSDGTATWVLPAERAKNGLPNQLTLPRMAVDLLPPPRTRETGEIRELIFGEGEGPFSGWSRCKQRLDARIAKFNGGKPIAPWVLHDLRRTFVTRLNDMGVEPHVIEALVNHAGGRAKAGVAGVYNLAEYADQKRAALALWCNHIAALVGEAKAKAEDKGRVVRLKRAS